MTSPQKRLTSFGECMIEFSRSGDGGAWMRKFAGDTLNTAWYFRRLSGEQWETAYFTAVGDDAPSRDLLAFIEGNGIATRFVQTVAGTSPGLYLIELEGAERHFSYWREASAARHLARDGDKLHAAMRLSDIIYFSGITLAILPDDDRAAFISALGAARREGRIVAFDPNIRARLWSSRSVMREAITEAAAASSIVFPTFSDEQAAFGDSDPAACAARYRQLGVETTVVKNGERPCLVATGDMHFEEPAASVASPLDTTGAGDSFNGAFLAGWTANGDIRSAVRRAHETAARTICGYGALVD